jgi:hypothetical protein
MGRRKTLKKEKIQGNQKCFFQRKLTKTEKPVCEILVFVVKIPKNSLKMKEICNI